MLPDYRPYQACAGRGIELGNLGAVEVLGKVLLLPLNPTPTPNPNHNHDPHSTSDPNPNRNSNPNPDSNPNQVLRRACVDQRLQGHAAMQARYLVITPLAAGPRRAASVAHVP